MMILGIDLGITRAAPCASALYDARADRVIETRSYQPARDSDTPDERIGEIALSISRYIDSLTAEPVALAYEMSHFQKNPQTALKLAKMAGALVFIASAHSLEVYEIQPVQAKLALAGYDKAEKADMQRAALQQYRLTLSSHEADAVGVALAGAAMMKREAWEAIR